MRGSCIGVVQFPYRISCKLKGIIVTPYIFQLGERTLKVKKTTSKYMESGETRKCRKNFSVENISLVLKISNASSV